MNAALKQKSVRGLETAWLEAGPVDGDILLLLHGFPDTAASWSYQTKAFKDRFHVIAPFIRGAGPSEAARAIQRYGTDGVALDILAILGEVDPRGERRIYLVGHDLGAVHAWHLARLLGQRVAAMVIINGLSLRQMLVRWRHPRQLLKSWYIFLMQLPLVPELAVRAAPRAMLSLAHGLGGLPQASRPDAVPLRGALAGPLNQYRAFIREIPRLTRRRSPRLTCPVLLLWGADDAFLVPPRAAELAHDATDVTIRIIEGNHWLQREQHEAVNGLIEAFFSLKSAKGDPA